jgi:hypothetical protein
LILFDNLGEIVWERKLNTIGDSFSEIATALSFTPDGGFLISGNVVKIAENN